MQGQSNDNKSYNQRNTKLLHKTINIKFKTYFLVESLS